MDKAKRVKVEINKRQNIEWVTRRRRSKKVVLYKSVEGGIGKEEEE